MKKLLAALFAGCFLPGIFGTLSFAALIICGAVIVFNGFEEFQHRYDGEETC